MKSIILPTVVLVLSFCISNLIWDYVRYDGEYCTVEIEHGRIRGKLNRTLFDEKLFYSFRGIPFAKPPLGDLRFKAPQINDPWTDTLDAFDFGNDCLQHISGDTFEGSEDCLYLNVYVPINATKSIDSNAKLPVVFYIHGGRFVTGTASDYAPDFLMEEDVIVVTSNHRVGPFGFLALKLPEYSGNMGLKDQSLALRWVSENIGRFGGDINRITVCGHSTGSVSVELHTISPHSSHLFERAIMLGGTTLNPYASNHHETSFLFDFAKQFNHSISNEYDLIEFLNTIDVHLLLRKTFEPRYISTNGSKAFSRRWVPVVEDRHAVNPFLTESVFDTFTSSNFESNIDVLFSSTHNEMVATDEYLHPELLKLVDDVFEFDLPLGNMIVDHNSELYKTMSKRIRDFYFHGKSINKANINRLNMLLSDVIFLYAIDFGARIHAKKSRTHTLYSKFTVENDWNLSARSRKESNFTAYYDAHTDQVYYLFWFSRYTSNEIYQSLAKNSLQRKIVKNVANYYANFAKYGNPMPSNKPAEYYDPATNQFQYYEISNDGISVRTDENRDRIEFWDNLFNEIKHHWNITYDFHRLL